MSENSAENALTLRFPMTEDLMSARSFQTLVTATLDLQAVASLAWPWDGNRESTKPRRRSMAAAREDILVRSVSYGSPFEIVTMVAGGAGVVSALAYSVGKTLDVFASFRERLSHASLMDAQTREINQNIERQNREEIERNLREIAESVSRELKTLRPTSRQLERNQIDTFLQSRHGQEMIAVLVTERIEISLDGRPVPPSAR